MNTEQRCDAILEAVRQQTGTDPVKMMISLARMDFVKIHGPEHHVLDGACLLMALHNLGKLPDIDWALQKLRAEGLRMPGAVCGLWGVCGAVTSVGAALAIWEGTGPLSRDGTWGAHMTYTSAALAEIAGTYGPRCCKRDGFIALTAAVRWLREHRGVELGDTVPVCGFFVKNPDCIGNKCPYYPV